ncbi:MAG: hypothetical protein GX365_01745 [Clostridiales bacterium]|nr:hypothetical protein [Clostridiales bacterium]
MQKNLKKWFFNNRPKLSILLIILVIIQFVTICYFNFTKSECFLDFDSALALRHGIDMWRNKAIFFENFAYVSSLELDCASFWAAPLVILTGNISLSFGIVHMLLTALIIFIILDIFHTIDAEFWCAALSVIFVMTPYMYGQLEYFNMIFISAGQYGFRVISVLLLIDLLLKPNYKCIKNKIIIIIYMFFLFITALSGGNYILLMGIAPLMLNEVINMIKNQKIDFKKPTNILLLTSGIISLIAISIRNYNIGAGTTSRSTLNLSAASEFMDNVFNCIVGIFMLCGGITHSPSIPITSLGGVARIFKLLFVAICIIVVPILVYKHRMYKKTQLFQMAFTIAAVNLFVLAITQSVYGSPVFEQRYHILWFVPIMLTCGLCFSYFTRLNNNHYLNNCIFIFFMVTLSLANLQGFKKVYEASTEGYDFSSEVILISDKYNTDTIILYGDYDKAHIIRALDYTKNAISLHDEDVFSAVILDYSYEEADSAILGTNNIFVASNEEFKTLPIYFKNRYTLVETINGVNYYYTENNPFDMYSGLPRSYNIAYNFPYIPSYKHAYSVINEDGYLISNGNEGVILTGAHGVYKPGNYDITIDYEIESHINDTAMFNIKANGSEYKVSLESTQDSTTINGIKADELSNIEVSIWCGEGTIIKVKGIGFERVG